MRVQIKTGAPEMQVQVKAAVATTASSKYWWQPYRTVPSLTVRQPCAVQPFLRRHSRLQLDPSIATSFCSCCTSLSPTTATEMQNLNDDWMSTAEYDRCTFTTSTIWYYRSRSTLRYSLALCYRCWNTSAWWPTDTTYSIRVALQIAPIVFLAQWTTFDIWRFRVIDY